MTRIHSGKTIKNIKIPLIEDFGIELSIKPEYLNHQFISGNKLRKLNYNLRFVQGNNQDTLLTFGGAFSNHIAATSYAGKIANVRTIGVIRGDELKGNYEGNPTLEFARKNGMEFKFVSRSEYKLKQTQGYIKELRKEFGDIYILPEGGTNELAVRGCEEILTAEDQNFDFICCPVGTGGTISGLINASVKDQKVLGFPALKGDFLSKEIQNFSKRINWELICEYHFGGYAKINKQLIEFINKFKADFNIPLDPVYTGKMMFGILDMIENKKFPSDSKILAIHTGGLQGIEGMNKKLKRKNWPLIL